MGQMCQRERRKGPDTITAAAPKVLNPATVAPISATCIFSIV